MTELAERIMVEIETTPGISDPELATALSGDRGAWRDIAAACRALEAAGRLRRALRQDGMTGNFPSTAGE